MKRRWPWTVLDLAALICLGQASLVAQRRPGAEIGNFDPVVELERAEQDFGRFGTRIFETPATVVVALKMPGRQDGAPAVAVEGGRIRLPAGAWGGEDFMPVPAGADAARYRVRRVSDEVRIIFSKSRTEGP